MGYAATSFEFAPRLASALSFVEHLGQSATEQQAVVEEEASVGCGISWTGGAQRCLSRWPTRR